MKKIICKIFGHKWRASSHSIGPEGATKTSICKRCGIYKTEMCTYLEAGMGCSVKLISIELNDKKYKVKV